MAFRSMQTLLKALPKLSSTVSRQSGVASSLKIHRGYHVSPVVSIPTDLSRSICKLTPDMAQFHQPNHHISCLATPLVLSSPLLKVHSLNAVEAKRTIVKFSMRSGRRKTVKAVVRRFLRLDWGAWIHPRSGRAKHLWKKGKLRRKRLRQHVFCNAWQTRTLDRMTTKYWHKKKYFVDDPYEPYHSRPDFGITKNLRTIQHQYYN